MSVKSVRTYEIPQQSSEVAKATASASTLQELINTIPQQYRVQLGDYLTKKYRVAHKHANVNSSVVQYQQHKSDNSFPPIIRNSLKEPHLMFAKEFLSTQEGIAAQASFRDAITLARISALDAAITEKQKELGCLAGLIKADVKDWQTRVMTTAKAAAIAIGGQVAIVEGTPEGKKVPVEFVTELRAVYDGCMVYTYRCLAVARASIDRTDLMKLSKLTLKKDADVDMTDAPNQNQQVVELLNERLLSFKRDLVKELGSSSTAQKREGSPLTPHRTKRSKVQSSGQELPNQGRESERERRAEEQEQKEEGVQVTLDHFLRCCSKDFRPWLPETFPNMYLNLNDITRTKISVAHLRVWEADTLRDAKPGVFKQEGVVLPEDIEYTLAVNHKFILHTKPEEHDVSQARDAFARTVRIRWQFRNIRNKEFIPKFHVPNPSWIPQHASEAIELGIDEAVREIDSQVGRALAAAAVTAPRHGNMNWTRVQDFLREHRLLVKLTDKNLGLAVFHMDWYIAEIMNMISDGKTYRMVTTLDAEKLFATMIKKLDKWKLPPNMDRFVREKTRKQIPSFHAIPKVHKTPWSLRPIVPSHSWVTSCLSQIIDHLCRPILSRLPWVVDSSKDVINNLEKIQADSDDVWICTGDVVAFYTNINSDECASVVAAAYQSYFPKSKIRGQVLAQMIQFVMKNNFFQFQGQVWQQLEGLAMGTSCAPVLANIYAASFERHKITLMSGVQLYNRYIDDILCLFYGSEANLIEFQKNVKLGSLTIKWDCSQEKNEFLDIEVLKRRNHLQPTRLVTRLFRKSMNRFLYIPWSSAHPLHVKKAFVKAELTRFAMINSEVEYFADARTQFYGNLRRRGYPPQVLDNWFTQVRYSERQIILSPPKEKPDLAPLMLAGQYNPVWEYINVEEILRKARRGWSLETELPDALNQPLIRSLRRTTSLGDLLSVWNKTILHPSTISTEQVQTTTSVLVVGRGTSVVDSGGPRWKP
jgi:hypothetical protein